MKKTLFFCTFYIIFFVFLICNINAQVDTVTVQTENVYFETDTVVVLKAKKNAPLDSVQMKKHSPKKASWLALIPGAGQIYNKKYWKLPIVYGGLAATGYFIYYFGDLTSMYRKEYVARLNEDEEHLNPDLENASTENIKQNRDYYRRNMEICVAACAIVYMLSILDACVDAHLYYYDVSENLSLGIKPKINYNPINGTFTPSMALIVKF